MGSKYFCSSLKEFVNRNYKHGKGDTYAAFILQNLDICNRLGRVGMITLPNWMTLSTFAETRKVIVGTHAIECLVDNGRGVWGSDFGSCGFILKKNGLSEYRAIYRKLYDKAGSVADIEVLRQRFFKATPYYVSSFDIKTIPNWPLVYSVSTTVRKTFAISQKLHEVGHPCSGIQTGDNARFLRYWFEVNFDKIGFGHTDRRTAALSGYKWFPHKKGGDFRRWYGNCEYVLNWSNDGIEIRSHPSARPQNLEYQFKEGVTRSIRVSVPLCAIL